MTDEENVARLAAILGIEGAVQYGRYRGYGERSHKRGHREARLGDYAGEVRRIVGARGLREA